MKTVTKFEAFDGTVFDDRKECERHEREHARARIVALTPEQIAGAFEPVTEDDHGLAAALEDVGVELRAARLARGDKRRKPKGDGEGGPKSEASEASADNATTTAPADGHADAEIDEAA